MQLHHVSNTYCDMFSTHLISQDKHYGTVTSTVSQNESCKNISMLIGCIYYVI